MLGINYWTNSKYHCETCGTRLKIVIDGIIDFPKGRSKFRFMATLKCKEHGVAEKSLEKNKFCVSTSGMFSHLFSILPNS